MFRYERRTKVRHPKNVSDTAETGRREHLMLKRLTATIALALAAFAGSAWAVAPPGTVAGIAYANANYVELKSTAAPNVGIAQATVAISATAGGLATPLAHDTDDPAFLFCPVARSGLIPGGYLSSDSVTPVAFDTGDPSWNKTIAIASILDNKGVHSSGNGQIPGGNAKPGI